MSYSSALGWRLQSSRATAFEFWLAVF